MENRKTPNIRVLTRKDLLGDIRRANQYRLFIEDVFEGNNLEFIVSAVDLPQETTTTLEIRHGNDVSKYASVNNITDWSFEILDVLNPRELDALIEWREQVRYEGNVGKSYKYKKIAYVSEYATDETSERTRVLRGVFPKDIQFTKLNAGQGTESRIVVNMSVDSCDTLPYHKGFQDDKGKISKLNDEDYKRRLEIYSGDNDDYISLLHQAYYSNLQSLIYLVVSDVGRVNDGHYDATKYTQYIVKLESAEGITLSNTQDEILQAHEQLQNAYTEVKATYTP